MDYQAIILAAAEHIRNYMEEHHNADLCFHNFIHTAQVEEAAMQIALHYELTVEELFAIQVAAYFHDIGYYTGPAAEHELRSAELAKSFLKDYVVPEAIVESVYQAILATRMPQSPQNLVEMIICDADLFHFGTEAFKVRNRLMRKETERTRGKSVDKIDWSKFTVTLMERHRFHTEYARSSLNLKKQGNLDELRNEVLKADCCKTAIGLFEKRYSAGAYSIPLAKKEKALPQSPSSDDKTISGLKSKPREKRPERGVETMFRLTSSNNQRLSDMADNKSHILITVNSIILSVIISFITRQLGENAHLMLPFLVLLAVSLSTIVLAILVTRPQIPTGVFSADDLQAKKVNLLFFGNYYKMPLQEYSDGMHILMEDGNFLYRTLIKDVYAQGVVLGRKYRLLRLAYNIFMFGLIAAVLLFIVVVVTPH